MKTRIFKLKSTVFFIILFLPVFSPAQQTPQPQKISKTGKISGVPLHEASIEDIDSENFPDIIKSFDYPNAQISDIVMAMSHLTGINFIIDPKIKGTISIIAPSPITVAEAFQAFLSALAVNGYALVRSGAFWKVVSAENASKDNLQVYDGEYFPDADQYITKVFKLKHANVKNLEKHLKQFLTDKKHKIMFYEQANTIIVSDYGSTIEKISRIIKELDVPDVHTVVEVVNIKHAPAVDLASKLQILLSRTPARFVSSSRQRPGSNLISSRTANSTGVSAIIPDERTNSIIISGSKKGINKAKALISKLDFYINPQIAGGIYVYYVKHGTAENIEKTLNSVLGPQARGSSKTSGTRPGMRPMRRGYDFQHLLRRTGIQNNIRVTHDKNTNSLLVTASKHDYDVLKSILAKIDIPKNQVFIKAIIMDLNAGDSFNWDLNYFNFSEESSFGMLPRMSFSATSIADLIQHGMTGNKSGSFLSFGTGDQISIGVGSMIKKLVGNNENFKELSKENKAELSNFINSAGEIQVPSLMGLVNIIKKTTNGNILSTPQIIAIDNEPSSISVGVNAPVGEKTLPTAAGASALNSYLTTQERKDIATSLKITPYINPDGKSVRLKIEQKIDSIDPTVRGPQKLQNSSIAITKREIKTNIILDDNETAVLGGLMKDEETEIISKFPILGDIPILGWLFKTKDIKKEKKNLLVFITPTIIKNTSDHKRVFKDKVDERIDFLKKYMDKTTDAHGVNFLSSTPPEIEEPQTAGSAAAPPSGSSPQEDQDEAKNTDTDFESFVEGEEE